MTPAIRSSAISPSNLGAKRQTANASANAPNTTITNDQTAIAICHIPLLYLMLFMGTAPSMSTPPPTPGNLIMWLLVIILFIVLLGLILSVADVHFD